MKRHTLFIYIAALLTMLGTALPMSAQNKSFTVNRNDCASQKYSYSQGDRLVLSREDSQGKKYADFVEQQVYVGNAVHNIPLTSIESITFDSQATEDEGKTFIVQESGGKIEYGDITIDFPSGTFNSSTKVTISEVEKGLIAGDAELTSYYKVKLSSGLRSFFAAGIKMPKTSNEEQLRMMFVTPGWAPSFDITGLAYHILNIVYHDGAYYARIPKMDNPDEVGETEVYFGLTTQSIRTSDSQTRESSYQWLQTGTPKDEELFWYGGPGWLYFKLQNEIIPAARKKIKELGFDKEVAPITYHVHILDSDDWGKYNSSTFGASLGSISLNEEKLLELKPDDNYEELCQSVLHETLHFYQRYYGLQTPFEYTMATVLDEATAVWSERYFGGMPSTNTKNHVCEFIPCIKPEHKDVLDKPYNKDVEKRPWDLRHLNVGYGMSSLIEYLCKKSDDKIAIELYKAREKDVYNTIGVVENYARTKCNGLEIFTPKGYKDFVEALGTGMVYETIFFADILDEARVKHGAIGVTSKKIADDYPVYLTNYAYGYGALVEMLELDGTRFNNDPVHGLDGAILNIKQTTPGLTTWVYQLKGGRYNLIGQIWNNATLSISSDEFNKRYDGQYTSTKFFFVTIKDDFKDDAEILSKIEAKVEKDENIENDPVMIKLLKEAMNFSININAKWNFAIWDNEHSQAFSGKSGDCQIGDYKNLMGPPTITVTNNGKTATVTAKGKEQSKGSNYISNEDKELTMTISKNIITSLTYKYNYYYVKHDDWWEEDDVHEIHISLSARDIPLKEMSEGMLGRCVFEGTSAQGCVIEEITESTTNQYWYSLLKDVSFQQDFTHENSTEKKHYNPIYSSVSGIQGWDYKINISFVSGGINFNGVR